MKAHKEHAEAILAILTPEEMAEILADWEANISECMPLDKKDWWQNSRPEWPMVARLSFENWRSRASYAEEHLHILLGAVEETLNENAHLADGDECTLLTLKRVYERVVGGEWRKEDECVTT